MSEHTGVAVGRQGIYDRTDLIGYELLFRDAALSPQIDGDEMTAAVIVGAMAIGLDRLVGPHKAFVNADYRILTRELPVMLPPERTVVEVVDTVDVDRRVTAGCAQLRADGYTLALDDFAWTEGQSRIVDLASIVKIDLMSNDADALREIADRCRGRDVRLLGKRLMDLEQIPMLTGLGFELFQGFALDRPVVVPGTMLTPAPSTSLTAAVDALDAGDVEAFEDIVRHDHTLTQQIIWLASVGRPGETRRPVTTIRRALVLTGTERVRNWLSLITAQAAVHPPTA